MDHQSQLALLDKLPVMIFRCLNDQQRTMLFAGEGCLELTGYAPGKLVENREIAFGELIAEQDRAMVQQEIERARQAGRAYTCSYRLNTAGHGQRWVMENGRGVFSEEGDLVAIEGLITDVTDQRTTTNQLQQQVVDQSRRISALSGILEAVSAPGELPVILRKSLNAALVAAQGDAGFIHLREKSGDSMRLVAIKGISERLAESLASISAQDGLMAWVAQNRRPVLIPSISEDPRTVYLVSSGDLKVYLGVPIARRQHVWGTLSLLGKDPSQFEDEEVALLNSVGEEIGIVLENARLRLEAERLMLVQERNRLARELHDSVTQSIYSVTLFAEAGRRMASARKNQETAGYFAQIGDTGQQALKEMRLLLHNLRPSILSKEGIVRALQYRLNSVEGRAGIKHRLVVEDEINIPAPLENAVYQCAQEALNNALKHAMASEVEVQISLVEEGQLLLKVSDNGRGFDPEAAAESDGMGLTSMRERAESFDGALTIQSVPGEGTTIQIRLSISPTQPGRPIEFDIEDLS